MSASAADIEWLMAELPDCAGCVALEAQLTVALHVGCDLTLLIPAVGLRGAVVEHMTGAWSLCVERGGERGGFQKFFAAYCADVNR